MLNLLKSKDGKGNSGKENRYGKSPYLIKSFDKVM